MRPAQKCDQHDNSFGSPIHSNSPAHSPQKLVHTPRRLEHRTHLFFSFLWFNPTLILTLASIKPIRVVGTRMKLLDRR